MINSKISYILGMSALAGALSQRIMDKGDYTVQIDTLNLSKKQRKTRKNKRRISSRMRAYNRNN